GTPVCRPPLPAEHAHQNRQALDTLADHRRLRDSEAVAGTSSAGRVVGRARGGRPMQVIYERGCGLDVHKRTVVACRIVPGPDRTPVKEVRSFGTLTPELLALADWLAEAGCTHVAMEATGVFWKPIYNLLEDQFSVLVANAQHLKAVPGRKTDVKDAEW